VKDFGVADRIMRGSRWLTFINVLKTDNGCVKIRRYSNMYLFDILYIYLQTHFNHEQRSKEPQLADQGIEAEKCLTGGCHVRPGSVRAP
jgi:hypothetical protein